MKPLTIRVRLAKDPKALYQVIAWVQGANSPAIGRGITINAALRDLAAHPSLVRAWEKKL